MTADIYKQIFINNVDYLENTDHYPMPNLVKIKPLNGWGIYYSCAIKCLNLVKTFKNRLIIFKCGNFVG